MTFVTYDVCDIRSFGGYDVCRNMMFVGYDVCPLRCLSLMTYLSVSLKGFVQCHL